MDADAEETKAELRRLRKSLINAWVLLGRCDNTLEKLENAPKAERRELIIHMRYEIMHAMQSSE